MTDFNPQNELETALVQATADIGAIPAFYRAFLDSTLLVICNVAKSESKVNSDGRGVVKMEDVQSLVQMKDSEGNFVIPIFSSFPRLQETGAGQVTCMEITGRQLLEIVDPNKPLVLNPMSDYSKEFTPPELAALRDGSLFRDPQNLTYPADAKVLPRLPAGYPEALIGGLKSLFARYPEITRAYLAGIDAPGSAEPPHPIVGIDLTSTWFDIVRDAGVVAREILGEDQHVDFLPLRHGDAVSDYMLGNMTPFYVSDSAPNAQG